MKMKDILGMMAAVLMLLLSSCSSEQEYGSVRVPEAEYAVRLSLDRSFSERKANTDESQPVLDEEAVKEKKVGKLYAVVFKSNGAVVTGEKGKETGDETFDHCIDVLSSPNFDNGGLSGEFEVGRPGYYQLCFVANPSESLLQAIQGLAGKKVSDFKQLLVEEEPATKPMLMTSDFMGAVVTKKDAADLSIVELTRAMARIDVVNKAPGVTIKKLVFKKRAKKTLLIADQPSFEEGYVEEKEYASLNLVGSVGGADERSSYKHKIYSYEQYGIAENIPALEITYEIDGQAYTRTVKFEKAAAQGGERTPIALKRNHLYQVNLLNASGNIGFELTVVDWKAGDSFEVTDNDIFEGISKKPVEIGDYLTNDGQVIKSTDTQNIESKKGDIIGVIYYVGEARIGKTAKEDLKAKNIGGQSNPIYGLAMALKDAKNGDSDIMQWRNSNTSENVLWELKGSPKECYQDVDGLAYTQKIFEKIKDGASTYPAFAAVKNYNNDNVGNQGNLVRTDWYLPAIGEWYDIIENLGGKTILNEAKTKEENKKSENMIEYSSDKMSLDNMNTYLVKAGGVSIAEGSYWTSSVYSNEQARRIRFGSSSIQLHTENKNDGGQKVRCVMAFCVFPRPIHTQK